MINLIKGKRYRLPKKNIEKFDKNNRDHWNYWIYTGIEGEEDGEEELQIKVYLFHGFSGGTLYNPWDSAGKLTIPSNKLDDFKFEVYEPSKEVEEEINSQRMNAFNKAKNYKRENEMDY